MTKINAEIIADSHDGRGNRITTFVLTFPRFILAELNTHRMFSKNSASSRAIPFKKMVESVENDPFIPIAWQKSHSGMQGTEYLKCTDDLEKDWLDARDSAIDYATHLNMVGLTKQLCNRLLEPYMWHKVILTATEFSNFFELRNSKYEYKNQIFNSKKECIRSYSFEKGFEEDLKYLQSLSEIDWLLMNQGQAEIHIMELAECMWDAYNENKPKLLKEGEWHCPMINDFNYGELGKISTWENQHFGPPNEAQIQTALKISTSRCARISYTTVGDSEKKRDYEADIKLHDRLLQEGHFSPFEHCAKMMTKYEYLTYRRGKIEEDNMYLPEYSEEADLKYLDNTFGCAANFRGFIQYRHLLQN